jgi:putative CocE/NonD family hydrolase
MARRFWRAILSVVAVVIGMVPAISAPAVAKEGAVWTPPPARYGVKQIVNYPFTMSDGTQLVGSIYYPADLETGERAPGTFPALITMTPYGLWDGNSNTWHQGADDKSLRYYASHGYIGVEVDTRGAARSEGEFEPWSVQERRDYLEVIDFVAHRLSGVNGKVGLAGMSYRGLNQLLAAGMLQQGSPVKAIAPHSAGATIYNDPFFDGGIPSAFWYLYGDIEAISEVPPPDQLLAPNGLDLAHLVELVVGRIDFALYLGGYYQSSATGGYMAHRDQWWDQKEPIHAAKNIVEADVPVLMTSGGLDHFGRSSLQMYAALQNAARGRSPWLPMDPRSKPDPRFQLVWSNSYVDGNTDYFLGYSLQWYDHWLKGIDNGVGKSGQTLYLQHYGGDGDWIKVPNSAYPMTQSYTPYYLAPNGAMTKTAAVTTSTDSLTWAPGQSLTYSTEPFQDGGMLAGPVSATIYAASTSADVELIATLNDVAPDGTVQPLPVEGGGGIDGALIGSARKVDPDKSWYDGNGRLIAPYHSFASTDEQPVPIGTPVRYDIELYPRILELEPGHRLQLVLESQRPALFPTTAQLPNLIGGSYLINTGGQHASHVNLPLLPRDAFPTTQDPTKVGLR